MYEIDVISLADNLDRRQQIASQLERSNLNWRFFDAHTKPSDDLILRESIWPRANGRILNRSELACYSSHYAIWKEVADYPDDYFRVVMEDDIILDTDFFSDEDLITNLSEKFGYLRFNGQRPACSQWLCTIGRHQVVRFKAKVHGTLCYLITSKAAKHLLLELREVERPIDVALDRSWAHGVPILCVYPFTAIERLQRSQLGDRPFSHLSTRDWVFWKALNQIEKIRCIAYNILYRVNKDPISRV